MSENTPPRRRRGPLPKLTPLRFDRILRRVEMGQTFGAAAEAEGVPMWCAYKAVARNKDMKERVEISRRGSLYIVEDAIWEEAVVKRDRTMLLALAKRLESGSWKTEVRNEHVGDKNNPIAMTIDGRIRDQLNAKLDRFARAG